MQRLHEGRGIDLLLSRLQRVKRTGAGRWIACCPAHEDEHPSLSIRELEDGLVLVHCFAGCGTADVVAAVEMDFCDLFPEQPIAHRRRRERRPFSAEDVLGCVRHEVTIVAIAASHRAQGRALSATDYERLQQAAQRLLAAVELSLDSAMTPRYRSARLPIRKVEKITT
jgi:hypothetical protein